MVSIFFECSEKCHTPYYKRIESVVDHIIELDHLKFAWGVFGWQIAGVISLSLAYFFFKNNHTHPLVWISKAMFLMIRWLWIIL